MKKLLMASFHQYTNMKSVSNPQMSYFSGFELMLASAPYAASKALCQMAKQSNSALQHNIAVDLRILNPKKSHSCRMDSMAPPDIKTNLYMLVMYKEGENVTRSD